MAVGAAVVVPAVVPDVVPDVVPAVDFVVVPVLAQAPKIIDIATSTTIRTVSLFIFCFSLLVSLSFLINQKCFISNSQKWRVRAVHCHFPAPGVSK
jgi:hypothetical protein